MHSITNPHTKLEELVLIKEELDYYLAEIVSYPVEQSNIHDGTFNKNEKHIHPLENTTENKKRLMHQNKRLEEKRTETEELTLES